MLNVPDSNISETLEKTPVEVYRVTGDDLYHLPNSKRRDIASVRVITHDLQHTHG